MPALVKEVVKGVLARLGRPALHVADMPVDLEQRVADILQRLKEQDLSGVAVLGLHGMGGIGKTTLANALFNALHAEFASRSCFVELGSAADDARVQQMQQKMLKQLCNFEMEVTSIAAGRTQLEERLRGNRVLLVIDDIWSSEQLDALLVSVGPGSRILLTTRDAQLLNSSRYPSILSHPVDVLSSQAALQLFSWCAFLAGQPPPEYSVHAAEAVRSCGGLPLTLIVLGAYLWDQRDKDLWEAALEKLRAAQSLTGHKTEQDKLWGKLWLSYDALGYAEQAMFQDIACCMLGKRVSMTLPAWGPSAKSTLRNLISRSLVSVDNSGQLRMHDQLRDMAREVVVMGNRRVPALRSHVWMPEAQQLANGKQVSFYTTGSLQCTT